MAACVERRAACGASYNACASGATPCKFETRQPARPAGKARADRQFQRRVGRRGLRATDPQASNPYSSLPHEHSRTNFGPIVEREDVVSPSQTLQDAMRTALTLDRPTDTQQCR